MSTSAPYDIFISYRTTHREWVEALAHNLKAQDYSVFLDAWEIKAGESFTQTIYHALDSAKFALLLATPDATESGWVQQEHEYMISLSNQREDFRWIPLVLGEFPDFPFLQTIQAIDFGDSAEETYRTAFQKLLLALKDQPPGSTPYYQGALQLPQQEQSHADTNSLESEQSVIQNVCSHLESGIPLMILAQDGTPTQHYIYALRQTISQHYPNETFLHLFPPTSSRADTADYFSRIAKQCGLDQNIKESWEWADALREQLEAGQEYVMFITGFENGADNTRGEFAAELRGLLEQFPFNLKLVIFGSERLAAAKHLHGKHSFLNTLAEIPLPDISLQDIPALYQPRYPDINLDENTLQNLLDFTGRHPRLLESALQCMKRGVDDWQNAIRTSPLTSQLFSRFRNDSDKLQLCQFLSKNDLGRYESWPQDELLRRLYWANLITDKDGRFVWRCELIQQTGVELLEC